MNEEDEIGKWLDQNKHLVFILWATFIVAGFISPHFLLLGFITVFYLELRIKKYRKWLKERNLI